MACDFQDDRQLQVAILEVLKRLSVDPQTIPSYTSFAAAAAKDAAQADEASAGKEVSEKPKEGTEEPPNEEQ